MNWGLLVVAFTLVALVAIFLWLTVKSVRQGEQWTIERFGRYTRTLDPGLHFIMPLVERVGERVNMKEQVIDIPEQEVISRDNAIVLADAVAYFQIVNAARASYEVQDLQNSLVTLATTNIRTVIGAMDLDDVLSNRDGINKRLLDWIDQATNSWGVKVTRVEIRDLSPPQDIVDAMGKQMKAEREKRAQILEADGYKQSIITRAQGEMEARVLEAQAAQKASLLEAEARVREAEAEAEATRLVSEAIQNGGTEAVNYFIAQKYVDSLRDVAAAPNAKLIMMPVETSGVISSIAGLGDLAKSITDKKKSSPEER